MRQRVDNGDLGDIKEIDLEFGFPLANEKRLFLKNGGGSTLDLAVYPIQISLWVFRQEPNKVMTFGKLNEDGLDMELQGELRFDSGVTKFKVSCLNGLSNTAVIKGTKGQITVSASIIFLTFLILSENYDKIKKVCYTRAFKLKII